MYKGKVNFERIPGWRFRPAKVLCGSAYRPDGPHKMPHPWVVWISLPLCLFHCQPQTESQPSSSGTVAPTGSRQEMRLNRHSTNGSKPGNLPNHMNHTVLASRARPAALGLRAILDFNIDLGWLLKGLTNGRQLATSGSVTQITKVTNPHKALGQDMHEEPSNKFRPFQLQALLAPSFPVVHIADHDSAAVL